MSESHSTKNALDLLVMTVLSRRGQVHGYGIASAIRELSDDTLRVDEGSLYPALHRMEESGWIKAEWQTTEHKRRARIYRMTKAGEQQLAAETRRWNTLANGVARVLRHA
jgi:PadR family transcriptional regulator, regulatory protein PadR